MAGPAAVLSLGAAAAAADPDALRAAGTTVMPDTGPLTITVPGLVAGWAAVASLGARLGWADRLAPAIALAAGGAAVSPGLGRALREGRDTISADPGLRAVFGDAGEGTVVRQPALAASLTELAGDWTTFYRGPLGQRLAAGLTRLGSPLTAADLAAHRAEITDPLLRYAHGAEWAAAPPPSQGATFLALVGSGRLLTDARRAQAARDALLGDPRTGPVDLPGLLLDAPRPAAGAATGPIPTGDTVAVTAVDADGTAVSLIQSLFHSFGSGLLEPDTGIVLHNRGSMFSLDPRHPGRLVPGSRPPHTLCPVVAIDGDTVLALGCQGGRSQPWILAQLAADALRGEDPQAIVDRPRWIIGPGGLVLEPGTPGAGDLTAAAGDLPVTTTAALHDSGGHVQLARLRGTTLDAASDPRADGVAAVLGTLGT
ncbi:gamma-glutamyltransferase [Actinoplanes friuliensis]|uniref:Tyramine oxidase n=1 Tax=Actinoplanes friuliensis DSM 7358 TaxID=1246995 RepID=U5VXS3_9ACTN|nr:gamma-glutamyltransferase [Actinoplanes friuliensis]AGZ41669.1 tyramine oxidase [Actinoplanes friuliensis DSM 7358]